MDDEGADHPTAPPNQAETENARLFLINGMGFGIGVPTDPTAYANWLKVIQADHYAVFGDLVVATSAIACIVKGGLLQSMSSPFGAMPTAQPPTSGRMN